MASWTSAVKGVPAPAAKPKPEIQMPKTANKAPSVVMVQEHQKNKAGMSAQQSAPLPQFVPQVTPGMSYNDALGRANAQLDPTFGRAVEGVKSQQRADTLNAGQIASNRGGAHSGLAADQINKVGIAAANNIANLEAERASTAAQMARAMVDRSEDRADRLRQQAFNEYMGQNQLGLQRDQFNRGVFESDRGYNRGVLESDRGYNYQVGRDAVQDDQWNKTFDANEEQRLWGNRFNYGNAIGTFGNGQQTLAMRNYLSGEDQRKLDNEYRTERDKVADAQWLKTFNEQVRQHGLGNALQWAQENRLQDQYESDIDSDLFNYMNKQSGANSNAPTASSISQNINRSISAMGKNFNVASAEGRKQIEGMIVTQTQDPVVAVQLYNMYGIPVPKALQNEYEQSLKLNP